MVYGDVYLNMEACGWTKRWVGGMTAVLTGGVWGQGWVPHDGCVDWGCVEAGVGASGMPLGCYAGAGACTQSPHVCHSVG